MLFSRGQFPCFRVDRQWRTVTANDAFVRLSGVALSALLGMSLWTAVPQLRGSAAGDVIRRAMRTRRIQTSRVPSAFIPGRVSVLTVGPVPEGVEVVGSLLAAESAVVPLKHVGGWP